MLVNGQDGYPLGYLDTRKNLWKYFKPLFISLLFVEFLPDELLKTLNSSHKPTQDD